MSRIPNIESDIYAQLAPLVAAGIRVRFLPEETAKIADLEAEPGVAIYLESYENDSKRRSLGNASSEAILTFSIEIQLTKLRTGSNSIYGAIELLQEHLDGFQPQGAADSIALERFQRQNARQQFHVVRGQFRVKMPALATKSGEIPPSLGGNLSTLVLDSAFDSEIELPLNS